MPNHFKDKGLAVRHRDPDGLITTGVVLIDQLLAIDRHVRLFDIIERAPDDFLAEVRGKIAALLAIETTTPPLAPDGA